MQAMMTLIQQRHPSILFLCETKVRDKDYMCSLRFRFYGHPTTVERFCTWDLLCRLGDESSLPWAVIGDFNELLHTNEELGGNPRRESQMELF